MANGRKSQKEHDEFAKQLHERPASFFGVKLVEVIPGNQPGTHIENGVILGDEIF